MKVIEAKPGFKLVPLWIFNDYHVVSIPEKAVFLPTPPDAMTISEIAERLYTVSLELLSDNPSYRNKDIKNIVLNATISLSLCHLNIYRLDLYKILNLKDTDLVTDISDIDSNIMDTGIEFKDGFVPKHSVRKVENNKIAEINNILKVRY